MSTEVIKARCSHLPRLEECPGSIKMPDIEVDLSTKPARTGSCVHAIMAEIVREDYSKLPDLTKFFEEYPDVDRDEVMILVFNGMKWWEKYRTEMQVLAVEKEFTAIITGGDNKPIKLTGHPDVLGKSNDGNFAIIDFKTEREERIHRAQFYGYAECAKEFENRFQREFLGAWAVTVWLRTGADDMELITPDGLDRWSQQLLRKLNEQKFHAGAHCHFCPHQLGPCQVRTAMVRQELTEWSKLDFEGATPPAAMIGKYYPMYQRINGLCNKFKELARMIVKENGTLPMGDGRELFIREEKHKKIQFSKSIDVLIEHFHPNLRSIAEGGEILDENDSLIRFLEGDVLKIGKTALEAKIKEYAPPRKGAPNIRKVFSDLEKAGAITVEIVEKLSPRKVAVEDKVTKALIGNAEITARQEMERAAKKRETQNDE